MSLKQETVVVNQATNYVMMALRWYISKRPGEMSKWAGLGDRGLQGFANNVLVSVREHMLYRMLLKPNWNRIKAEWDTYSDEVMDRVMEELYYDGTEAGVIRKNRPDWTRKALHTLAQEMKGM